MTMKKEMFAKAFHDGQLAAGGAGVAHREIDAVFADMNRQLAPLVVTRATTVNGQEVRQLDLLHDLIASRTWEISKKLTSVAFAQWSQSNMGYPFHLRYGNVSVSCEDRIGLEQVLCDMLRDVSVGRILQQFDPQGSEY